MAQSDADAGPALDVITIGRASSIIYGQQIRVAA